ncbi:hypothetical protein NHX12_003100, partial [Muraenolepis orangiensis]
MLAAVRVVLKTEKAEHPSRVMERLAGLLTTSGLTTTITITLFLVFLGLLYRYSVSPYSTLSRCGIKHPRPLPFFGNLFLFRQ